VISAQAITKRFGERVAVEHLSFEVGNGEVFGLLGPNGAGKTTTLRMLAGLILPSEGSITIGGRRFTRADAGAIRARIGFLTETPGLWDNLTVEDNLCLYARLFGMPRPSVAAELVLRPFELWDRRADKAGLLSKGMKQKLALARALVHQPDVVLLDEPTANLDPQTSRMVRDLLLDLRAQGRAVVISTHNLDEVERLADRVALISRTLIAIGAPATLRRDVFGRRLRVRMASGYPPLAQLAAVVTRAGGQDVRIEGHALSMVLETPDAAAPSIVRRLVDAGAEVREVFDEQPALEDVYLKLLNPKAPPSDPRHPQRQRP
jgi:ABC-2 type transport system ATP-binding protein